MSKHSVFSKILQETDQAHEVRIPLIQKVERHFDRKLVVFQTSFNFENGIIEDRDAVMLEEMLLSSKAGEKLLLMINSPGGFGLSAERIVRICRKYSNEKFEVLVPRMAKSAATIICFGAKQIWMSNTSELGPVDPQLIVKKRRLSVFNILRSYRELMNKATSTKGKIEPYLQQLMVYDPRYMKQLEQEMELSEKMAVQLLQTGMLKGKSRRDICRRIKIFLNPEETLEHGRPIYREEVQKCGIITREIKLDSIMWDDVWSLQMRYDFIMSHELGKIVETAEDSYMIRGYNNIEDDDTKDHGRIGNNEITK
jgi:hypothetical protein